MIFQFWSDIWALVVCQYRVLVWYQSSEIQPYLIICMTQPAFEPLSMPCTWTVKWFSSCTGHVLFFFVISTHNNPLRMMKCFQECQQLLIYWQQFDTISCIMSCWKAWITLPMTTGCFPRMSSITRGAIVCYCKQIETASVLCLKKYITSLTAWLGTVHYQPNALSICDSHCSRWTTRSNLSAQGSVQKGYGSAFFSSFLESCKASLLIAYFFTYIQLTSHSHIKPI